MGNYNKAIIKPLFIVAALSILSLFLLGSQLQAEEALYSGPIGDTWYPISELVIPADGIELNQDTVLNVDRLILNGDITTLGYRLKINAREIYFNNDAGIFAFKNPQSNQVNIPANHESSARNGTHAPNNSTHGTHGSNGISGNNGFEGINGRQDSKEIDIFALNYYGKIKINGTGQKGGKGGKGGRGQDGGRGGDGRDAWADVDCLNNKKGENGTNGGNGGYPGEPGIGGQGGMGGNNAPVILYSALSINPENLSVISNKGIPGDAGAAGTWGKPGEKGTRGSSARKEKSCGPWFRVYTVVSNKGEGSDGKVLDYSTTFKQQKLKEAKGKNGVESSVELVPPQKVFYQSLRKKQLSVYDNAYHFHYARLFQFLVQDAIRLATQSQFTRSMLGVLDEDMLNEMLAAESVLIDQLIYSWKSYYIDRMQGQRNTGEGSANTELSFEQEEYLERAQALIRLLEQLKDPQTSASDKLVTWNQQLESLTDKTTAELLNLNQSCTNFLREKKALFADELPFTDFFHLPACTVDSMRALVKDPAHKIVLVAQRSENYIFPQDALSLNVEVKQRQMEMGDRTPQANNPFQVVIVNNQRFTLGDFATLQNIDSNEISEAGLLNSMETIPEDKVTLKSYSKYIQILFNGISQ